MSQGCTSDFTGIIAGPAPPPSSACPARPAPFSLRLSAAERVRLESDARGAPLGAYVKAKLFDRPALPPLKRRRSVRPVGDDAALAQALALLGSSRIASNLNQLAHAANIGALPVDSETIHDLNEAVDLVREIRALLVAALGLKTEGPPSSFAKASEDT